MTKQPDLAFLFTLALLFVLCGAALAQQNDPQNEDDAARILGDERFRTGRQSVRQPRQPVRTQPTPGAASDELIGVTFWRLSPATEASRRLSSAQDEPSRLLIPT